MKTHYFKGIFIAMKKFKNILTIIFIIVFFSGLIYSYYKEEKEFRQTEFLFDTTCTISASGKDVKNVCQKAFSEVEEIHKLTNFYSDNSDVSKINKAKENEIIIIDKRTMDILEVSLEICEKSGGNFDITIAPLSTLWDFKSKKPKIPTETDIFNAKKQVDFKNIVLDKENLTVKKLDEKTKIDLGAVAKGYASDKAVEIFKKHNISAVIDLGGNVSCTGKNLKPKNGLWKIGLQTPFKATGSYEKTVELEEGTVVTSGTYQRYFELNEKNYHHLIDPKTGYPKEADYNAVTVVGKSSLLSDCLSTACFILGKDEGEKLAKYYNVEIYYY